MFPFQKCLAMNMHLQFNFSGKGREFWTLCHNTYCFIPQNSLSTQTLPTSTLFSIAVKKIIPTSFLGRAGKNIKIVFRIKQCLNKLTFRTKFITSFTAQQIKTENFSIFVFNFEIEKKKFLQQNCIKYILKSLIFCNIFNGFLWKIFCPFVCLSIYILIILILYSLKTLLILLAGERKKVRSGLFFSTNFIFPFSHFSI